MSPHIVFVTTLPSECNGFSPHPVVPLTRREQEVLALLANGLTNAQIAHELHLAEQTIRNYVSAIYHALGVANRAEAILWAIHHGYPIHRPGFIE